jgi:hypothetical protein
MPLPTSLAVNDVMGMFRVDVGEVARNAVTAGWIVSTETVALGPAAVAGLPAASVAVPAAIDIPSVPLPVIPEMVTSRVVVSMMLTPTVPVAVPVVSRVIAVGSRLTELAPVYVTV